MRLISPPWYDKTWWEIDLPETCEIVEKSAQHVRVKLGNGARVLVGLRKNITSIEQAQSRGIPVSAVVFNAERWAFETTKTAANPGFLADLIRPRSGPDLERHELGLLVGYTYERESGGDNVLWTGYFGYRDWALTLSVECSRDVRENARAEVRVLLAGMSFEA